jgi:ferric-dicitrate binding protein FerR (iron transport regulator)
MAERSVDSPLDNLLARLVDRRATPEDIAALESILARDPAARRRYVHYLDLHLELRERAKLGQVLGNSSHSAPLPLAMFEPDQGALLPSLPGTPASTSGFWSRSTAAWRSSSPPMRAAVIGAALSLYFIGLLIAVAYHRGFQVPDHVPDQGQRGVEPDASIARLLEPTGCVWKADAAQPGSTVAAGEALELVSGVAKFRFHSGVDITAVGPCVLKFISADRLRMEQGKLIARVPRQAVGFTVEADRVEIVDLGTEFGVEIDELGRAEVHMIEGAAEVRPRIAGDSKPSVARPRLEGKVRLTAGQAVRVSEAGAISSIDSDPARFAGVADKTAPVAPSNPTTPAIPATLGNNARLDVVDLLCGGDGTGHNRGLAIDPATGQFGKLPFTNRVSDGQFHPTPNHRLLDGCFMPDGEMQIDTAGHRFDFPKTSRDTWDHIRAGGELFGTLPGQIASKLGDVDYGEPQHGFLLLLPNAGLTLDLAGVRRGRKQHIRGFRAIVGSSFVADWAPKSDFFVIVDGQARFERRGFTLKDMPFEVYVPLDSSDSFLTLAATDGGDRSGGDWIGLGDPVLELRDP